LKKRKKVRLGKKNTFSKKTLLTMFEKLVQELTQLDREMFSHYLTNDLVIPCGHCVP
jgi:hypothetical protein